MSVKGGGREVESTLLILNSITSGGGVTFSTELLAEEDRRILGYSMSLPAANDESVRVEARLNVGQDRNLPASGEGDAYDIGGFFSVVHYLGFENMSADGVGYSEQNADQWFGEPGFEWNEDSPLILAAENSGDSTQVTDLDANVWYIRA